MEEEVLPRELEVVEIIKVIRDVLEDRMVMAEMNGCNGRRIVRVM